MPGREREEIVGGVRRPRGRGEREGGAGWRRGGGADGGPIPRGLGVGPARPAGLWASRGWTSGSGGDPGRLGSQLRPTGLSGLHARRVRGSPRKKDLEAGRVAGDSSGGCLRRPVFPLGGRLVRSETPGAGKPRVGAGPPRLPSRWSEPGARELVSAPPVLATRPTPVVSA